MLSHTDGEFKIIYWNFLQYLIITFGMGLYGVYGNWDTENLEKCC